jgi:serine/threonine-protein kinase
LEVLQLIAREFDEAAVPDDAEQLLALAKGGDKSALMRLWHLAAEAPDDDEIPIDILPRLGPSSVRYAVGVEPDVVEEVLGILREHVRGGNRTGFGWVGRVVLLILGIGRAAATQKRWDLLEVAFSTLCVWDEQWNRWDPQKDIKNWLRAIRGDAANTVASVLRDYPDVSRHLSDLAKDNRVDRQIRLVIREALG